MENDLIRRSDLYALLADGERYGYLDGVDISKTPAVDAVEVVRCRECVHIRPIVDMETGEEMNAYWCELLDLESCDLDDYCSMGKRREDGDT